jgi:hypothetical protein
VESTMLKRKTEPSKNRADGVGTPDKKSESPFEKFRGIGNPGIPRGKKAIIRCIREMRGN